MKKNTKYLTFKNVYLILLLIVTYNSSFCQIQIGSDIIGESATGGWFGYSVSMSADGERVVIGDPYAEGMSSNSGQVRVYENSAGEWVQLGSDIESLGGQIGIGVSMSFNGNRIAVGAPFGDGLVNNSGIVRLFEFTNGNWTQIGNTINGDIENEIFGSSVSISNEGDRVAISAPNEQGDLGRVKVFELSGNQWIQLGNDFSGSSYFGWSVSLSGNGNYIAIGTPRGGINNEEGFVQVYRYENDEWIQVGNNLFGDNSEDWFGWSVSISKDGSTLAASTSIGDFPDQPGYAKVYRLSNNEWESLGEFDEINQLGEGSFAVSLSEAGDRVAISSVSVNVNNEIISVIRLYEFNGGNWNQIGLDIKGESSNFEGFGISTDLSINAKKIAIGVPFGPNGNGLVKVYEFEELPTSINDLSQNNFINLFPNPAYDIVQIENLDPAFHKAEIINIQGKKVHSSFINSDPRINISHLPSGMYIINLHSNHHMISAKLIKK